MTKLETALQLAKIVFAIYFAILGWQILQALQKKPALKQLMEVYDEYQDPVVALQEVPKKEVSNYGVIGGVKAKRKNVWEIFSTAAVDCLRII